MQKDMEDLCGLNIQNNISMMTKYEVVQTVDLLDILMSFLEPVGVLRGLCGTQC
jgi:hypothetical protein